MTHPIRPPRRTPATAKHGRRMTYQQFLRRDSDHAHYEWVDGRAVEMSPVTAEHDDVSGFLIVLLMLHTEAHDAGTIRHRPFQMKTGTRLPGRAPDVLYVAKKNVKRLKRLYVDGPADLAVEVVGTESRSTDRGAKHDEYERGSVKEYWLIDPERKHAEFNHLGRDGHYAQLPLQDGIFRSAVMKGLWLKVDWLWRRPPILSVLKDWELSL